MTGAELLDRIPEHLRDVPHKDLEGATPREAVTHIDEWRCLLCQRVLEDMADE